MDFLVLNAGDNILQSSHSNGNEIQVSGNSGGINIIGITAPPQWWAGELKMKIKNVCNFNISLLNNSAKAVKSQRIQTLKTITLEPSSLVTVEWNGSQWELI